jgi:hypothetical protein
MKKALAAERTQNFSPDQGDKPRLKPRVSRVFTGG